MQLKEFSLVSLLMESGEVLKAIETAIPAEAIEQVLGQTDSRETRKRKREHPTLAKTLDSKQSVEITTTDR